MESFDRVVSSRLSGEGRFDFEVPEGWGTVVGANGGYVAAVLLGALAQSDGVRGRPPRALTLHFIRALKPGPACVVVDEEHVGRGMTRLSARVVQRDRTCQSALAMFSSSYGSASSGAAHAPMPSVPAPGEVARLTEMVEHYTLFRRLDVRPLFGSAAGTGGPEPVLGGWTRLLEPHPLTLQTAALFADAWWPRPWSAREDLIPAPTIEMTLHFVQPPPSGGDGWALCRFEAHASADGFYVDDGCVWSPDGTLLVRVRQTALLPEG